MHWLVGLLCWVAVALTLAFAVCRLLGLWTQTSSWLRSSQEEKANLTRCGIYTPNGLLVKTDADDILGENFHRFDLVDADYSMTSMAIFPVTQSKSAIPPQPLRPAPNILPPEPKSPNCIVETTVTCSNSLQEKSDSFFFYNISTAITKSLISSDAPNLINCDNTTPAGSYEENDQNDWNTRNNLNNFKKPDYTSTNPFLINSNQINYQINPFHARENSSNQSNSTDDGIETNIAANDDSEANIRNLQQARRLSKLIRQNSYDSEFQNEEIGTSSSSVRRAISCDSVSSDTSLGPLESPMPTVTGQLCLSLHCFKVSSTESLLGVNVIEARNLPGDSPDTYVGIFLSPDHQGGHFKSKICRGTNCPSYNETFLVDVGKPNRKLNFHIYATEQDNCTLIGEVDLSLHDASSYKQPVTTWLTLTDSGQGAVEYGEIMLSMSYLPTAERLTLILARARRLPDPVEYNMFVKVYLQRNGKKVAKKRSSIKRGETTTTFNEAFIFSVPPHLLSSVELRVTLVYFPADVEFFHVTQHQKIGHIVLSREAHGKAGNHWNQMVTSLRKPVTMWHPLRRPHNIH